MSPLLFKSFIHISIVIVPIDDFIDPDIENPDREVFLLK